MTESAEAVAPSWEIELIETGERYTCYETESLLRGMARLGRRGIPVGCLSGGCGVCKVRIERGTWYKTGPMSRAHVSEDEEASAVVLACRVAPTSSCALKVVGKMQKSVLKVLKSGASSPYNWR